MLILTNKFGDKTNKAFSLCEFGIVITVLCFVCYLVYDRETSFFNFEMFTNICSYISLMIVAMSVIAFNFGAGHLIADRSILVLFALASFSIKFIVVVKQFTIYILSFFMSNILLAFCSTQAIVSILVILFIIGANEIESRKKAKLSW